MQAPSLSLGLQVDVAARTPPDKPTHILFGHDDEVAWAQRLSLSLSLPLSLMRGAGHRR